jgi:predicted dehydrogenase
MANCLVVGLGMGQQYKRWLEDLSLIVITVDPNPDKKADFTDLTECLKKYNNFTLTYVGTPNYTHESIARQVAAYSKCILIEKPGLENSHTWKKLVEDFPTTRISMVKNNQHRLELSGFKNLVKISKEINITWSREKGIPVSDWFKKKDLAFGGVSRDLMPHLLSYYTTLADTNKGSIIHTDKIDYNNTGIDDYAFIQILNDNKIWNFTANWQNLVEDRHCIEFVTNTDRIKFELGDYVTAFGGCPSYAYHNMIDKILKNLDNEDFWHTEFKQDFWIHQQLEKI